MIYTFSDLMDHRLNTLIPQLEAGEITAEEFKRTIRRIVRRLKRGGAANPKLTETPAGRRMRAERGQM